MREQSRGSGVVPEVCDAEWTNLVWVSFLHWFLKVPSDLWGTGVVSVVLGSQLAERKGAPVG